MVCMLLTCWGNVCLEPFTAHERQGKDGEGDGKGCPTGEEREPAEN